MSEIAINERASIKHDGLCWVVRLRYKGLDRRGAEKVHIRTTYHANLEQVGAYIINRTTGECSSLEEIIQLLKDAKGIVTGDLEQLIEDES